MPDPAMMEAAASRRKRYALLGVLAVCTAALLLWLLRSLAAGPSAEDLDNGSAYYRVTTDVVTEGSPLQLDVVVRCRGYAVARTPGGSGALDYTQVPYLYGLPTPAGHAVLMRVPNFCGLIRSGYEQAKAYKEELKAHMVLPLLFWAPDRDDLSRMTAYTSLKGYASEGSHMTYVGSRFAEVTRGDWVAWKERDPAFVKRENDPFFVWKADDGRESRGGFPLLCYGLLIFPIPPQLREALAAVRPPDASPVWAYNDLKQSLRAEIIAGLDRDAAGRRLARMWFLGGAKSDVDVLPYTVRYSRGRDEMLTEGRADLADEYVTVRQVDLDSPVRGRAECVHAADYTAITLFKKSGEIVQIENGNDVFIDLSSYLEFHTYGRIQLIEGSYEGMPR